jgi:hypothetical protein
LVVAAADHLLRGHHDVVVSDGTDVIAVVLRADLDVLMRRRRPS